MALGLAVGGGATPASAATNDIIGTYAGIRPLIRQEGRSFRLTADGEMLLSYARDILRLNDEAATYFIRVQGDSMTGAGIQDGDILIVDRSLEPVSGKIVIAVDARDGLVATRRAGTTIHYRIADPRVARIMATLHDIFCPPEN